MRDLPPQGSIEDVFLPRLVAGLHLHEFEGSLRLTLPDSVKILYFRKGEIASAASNADVDRLANILIHEGRLTTEQLEMARARLTPGASLGKTLIELGFLTPTELLQGARRQVQVIVTSCFAAASGGYEMVPGPLPPEVTSLGLGTRRLLFDSLAQSVDRASIIREIGSMEAVYRPTDHLDLVLASLKLDSETDRIARLLNGATSLRDLSGRTSHDDFTVGRVVLALELLGAAERLDVPQEEAAVAADAPVPFVEEALAPAAEGADDGVIVIEEESPEGALLPLIVDEAQAPAPPEAAPTYGDHAPLVAPDEPASSGSPEPPPIPPDELPAFTRPPDELPAATPPPEAPDGEPRWEIDPVTGERMHQGPIEMTFDGRIAQGQGESRNAMRLLVGAGAVTLVLGGALGYVLLRRGEGEPVAATRSVSAPPVAARTVAPGPAAAAPEPAPSVPEAAPAAARPASAAAITPAGEPVAPPAATTPPREPAAPAMVTNPAPAPPAIAPARRARRQLDQGDVVSAARQFESWVLAGSPGRSTLQVMIACQEDTVKKAGSRAAADTPLFVLPYALKGRTCYRVCWGLYDDGDAAREALSEVPAALTGSAVPLVVPVSRLKSSG
jgi:hypothetical protein